MAESSCPTHCDGAGHRFSYRRASALQDASSIEPQLHNSGRNSPVLPPLASSPTHARVTDVLDAFLNSREENALDMLALFTQLTENDRAKALAGLEGEDGDAVDDAQLRNGTAAHGRKPVTHYSALRRRLHDHGRQHWQRKRHVDVRNYGSSYVSHSAEECTHGDAFVEDVEVVELQGEMHTGNLVAFFEKGVTDVPTSFDSFFEADLEAPQSASVRDDTSDNAVGCGARPGAAPLLTAAAPFVLDDLLAVDDVDEEASAADKKEDHSDKVCAEEVVAQVREFRPPSPLAAISSSFSDLSSLELPGLGEENDGEVDGAVQAETAVGGTSLCMGETEVKAVVHPLAAEAVENLHAIITEHDDCVQSFALDPLFDYDADLFGEAFRRGEGWRMDIKEA